MVSTCFQEEATEYFGSRFLQTGSKAQ